jgi:hypothetical protein
VRADLDGVQCAVVGVFRMVGAVFDGTLDAVIFLIEFHMVPPL